MLDFVLVNEGEITISDLVSNLSVSDLRELTNEMIDTMLGLIAGCLDFDVIFEPQDAEAYDRYAEDEEDINLAWTLGHVIVHTTASSEEAGALAAELARGVSRRRARSRVEVPWQSVTTIQACIQKLEESRRMRLASLDMWPDEPHLDNIYENKRGDLVNAVVQFTLGLVHDDSHLKQIENIVKQSSAARHALLMS
jgi:hypothetical protein